MYLYISTWCHGGAYQRAVSAATPTCPAVAPCTTFTPLPTEGANPTPQAASYEDWERNTSIAYCLRTSIPKGITTLPTKGARAVANLVPCNNHLHPQPSPPLNSPVIYPRCSNAASRSFPCHPPSAGEGTRRSVRGAAGRRAGVWAGRGIQGRPVAASRPPAGLPGWGVGRAWDPGEAGSSITATCGAAGLGCGQGVGSRGGR